MARAGISGNVVRLRAASAVEPVAGELAAATGDATIRVLYRIEGDPPSWADANGARREPIEPSDDRATTAVELDGAQVAEIEAEHRIAGLCAQVRQLEGAEQRLRDVFEAVELIVIAMDLDAQMTYVNPFTERISGWTRDELIGQNWFETF